MATAVTRDDALRLQVVGALVVEVLPRAEYEWKHIAGAVSLPLTELDADSARARLDDRPIVVYCHDFQ